MTASASDLAYDGIRNMLTSGELSPGQRPTQPYGIQDLLRTIFTLLGVDSDKVYHTPLGRPVPIVNGGKRIDDLLA